MQEGHGCFLERQIATSPGWDGSPSQVTLPYSILLGCFNCLPDKSSVVKLWDGDTCRYS